MTFWEVFDFIYGSIFLLVVAYFSIMSAFIPKPKYIHDDEDNDEQN